MEVEPQKNRITEMDIAILRGWADNNMNRAKTAKSVYYDQGTISRHLTKIHYITGKDPRNFYELHELINKYVKGEIDFGRSHSD